MPGRSISFYKGKGKKNVEFKIFNVKCRRIFYPVSGIQNQVSTNCACRANHLAVVA